MPVGVLVDGGWTAVPGAADKVPEAEADEDTCEAEPVGTLDAGEELLDEAEFADVAAAGVVSAGVVSAAVVFAAGAVFVAFAFVAVAAVEDSFLAAKNSRARACPADLL